MSDGLRIDAQTVREEIFEPYYEEQHPNAEEQQRALDVLSDEDIDMIIFRIRDESFWDLYDDLVRQAVDEVVCAVGVGSGA